MNRKAGSEIIVTLLLIGMLALAFNIKPIESNSETITVPDDYPTIQEAINNANEGDTIYVRAGIYYENVVVNKTNLMLVGENRDTTIIDGGGEDGVTVNFDNALIAGFAIQNCYVGVCVEWSNNIIIEDNTIGAHEVAVSVGITIFALGGLPADNITIVNNIIMNTRVGININGVHEASDGHIITNNVIVSNEEGIWVCGSKNTNIFRNNIVNNKDYGVGLWAMSTTNNSIFENNIENNGNGTMLKGCSGNFIYHNNFVNNTQQVYIETGYANFWDDGYPSGGNYWSDYNGSDIFWGLNQELKGCDMIGDTPYVIDEDNQDRYPLMIPWRECKPPITEFPDLNGDGIIDIRDITIVAMHFGEEFENP